MARMTSGRVSDRRSLLPLRSRGCAREALAAEVRLAELVRLDLRAHRAVDDEDALAQDRAQRRFDFGLVEPILTHDLCATAVMT